MRPAHNEKEEKRMQQNIDPILDRISPKGLGDRITDEEAEIIEGVFCELYSSVLRFTRGGGEINHLVESIRSASFVIDRLSNCSQRQMERHLRRASDWKHDDMESPLYYEHRALDRVCSGALQSVASRLIGPRQGGATSRASEEMLDGIESYLETQRATSR